MFGILIEGEFLRDEVYDTIEGAEARIRVLQELDREEWPDEEDADYSAVKIDPDTMVPAVHGQSYIMSGRPDRNGRRDLHVFYDRIEGAGE